ncbi:MAG: DUF697 domain-containing protein [bacterium]|nr:DUF697 domain-containing protein [bacterium]
MSEEEKIDEEQLNDEEELEEDADNNYEKEQCDKIVTEHVLWALGAGFVPIPLLDIVAVSLVQLDMLKQICKVYDKSFSESEGKTLLTALTGGVVARLGASVIKALPGIGTIIGGVSMSVMAGATTYAIAQVAIFHFASGGDFFDFDMDAAKKIYEDEIEKGKAFAQKLDKKRKSKKGSDNIVEKLEKLNELKTKGLISEEEYEEKKAKLLEQF